MVIDLEQLVAQVLNRLKQREEHSYNCTYEPEAAIPASQVFLDNASVTVDNVSIELIVSLYRLDFNNPWVKWLLQGIDYQVHIHLVVNELTVNFIPRKMLLDWPVQIMTTQQQPILALYEQHLSRATLAALPDKTILVVTPQQRLTAEATDVLSVKKMKMQMRTDEDCIWQK
ncbi:microcompartment protein PduM [Levilactobacillus brevis]|nr:microcompartment protein PduM [Levilactobacillus brevis]